MKVSKHTERARTVIERLEGWGFPPEVQQRLGVLGIVWGVFETNLEGTLWVNRPGIPGAIQDSRSLGFRLSWVFGHSRAKSLDRAGKQDP